MNAAGPAEAVGPAEAGHYGARWVATSSRGNAGAMLLEMWRARGMLVFLGWRVLRRIYRRTILGWLWLFILPLFPLLLQTIVFGTLLNVYSFGIPYFLFLSVGMVAWGLFSQTLMWGTRGLEMNRNLVEVVYLPRAIFPLGNMTPAFLDLGIRCIVLVLTVVGYRLADGRLYVLPELRLLWALAAAAAILVLAVAAAMFTSVWGESTRDMRYTLAQVLPVWFLFTPVLYPLEQVPADLRAWMAINPMTPLVETFRWGLLGVGRVEPVPFAFASAASVLLLAAGIVYFARVDRRAADAR